MSASTEAPQNSPTNRILRQWPQRYGSILLLVTCTSLAAACGREEADPAASQPPPIEIRASVRPAQAMTLVAEIDGRVRTVGVSDGSAVTETTAIVELDNPAVVRDAAVATAQLQMIEARLRRGGARPAAAPIRGSDSLQIATRILELRRQRYEKMKSLRGTRDVTTQDLEQAEVEYLAALRDYEHERRAASAPASAPATPGDTELLRLEQQRVLAEQRFAQHRQTLLRVVSPFAGVVTRLHVARGQAVYPRDPIADVADVRTLQVRGEVAPELVRYLRPGMRVDVRVLSVPVRTFADEIDAVVPVQAGDGASRSAAVVVTIPNPDGSLQPNTDAVITVRPQP
jgi:multidrug efflux pump subunit AcrA (membrane-fusion protein)